MDIWHYPRTQLATFILNGMDKGLLQRVSIFAPRKRGKTQFIQKDIIPMARELGVLPIYVDFWMQKNDPEGIFIKSVIDACERNEGFLHKLGKALNFKKLGFSAAGGKVEVERSQGELRADLFAVFQRLNELDMPVLLLLDEVQHLATRKEFDSFTAALRSFVVNREDNNVKCIFTGSSREGLSRLFKDNKAPFYNSSQTQIFEELDMDFVEFELAAFKNVTGGVELDKHKALEILIKQNRAPARFVEMLMNMALNMVHDLDIGVHRYDVDRIESEDHFSKTYEQLKPIEVAILKLVAANESKGLYTKAGLNKVKAFTGDPETDVTKWSVKNAVTRLKSLELIYSPERGKLEIENHDFRDYILEK